MMPQQAMQGSKARKTDPKKVSVFFSICHQHCPAACHHACAGQCVASKPQIAGTVPNTATQRQATNTSVADQTCIRNLGTCPHRSRVNLLQVTHNTLVTRLHTRNTEPHQVHLRAQPNRVDAAQHQLQPTCNRHRPTLELETGQDAAGCYSREKDQS